jgi:hypothetical protein
MKRIVLYLTALLLLFVACEKNPKDVKPIDWEDYNDVYTVYWNCYSSCDKIKSEYAGKIIKISGWKAWSYDSFNLCDDAKYADRSLGYSAAFPFIPILCNLSEFKTKMDTNDLTKKCFIKGIIYLESSEEHPRNCIIAPYIEITNIDNIYFK